MSEFTAEQRAKISAEATGKMVESLEFNEDPRGPAWSYWSMTFTDSTEISFKFMRELISP